MDLNELLHAHQVEVMKAAASGDEKSRQHHFDQVAIYAERLRQLKGSRRTPDPAPHPSLASLNSWEDEGGALDPPLVPLPADTPLPSGITANLIREYHVGPYVYQDLSLAMAENERQKSNILVNGAVQ
jgi:hypothetical protein